MKPFLYCAAILCWFNHVATSWATDDFLMGTLLAVLWPAGVIHGALLFIGVT